MSAARVCLILAALLPPVAVQAQTLALAQRGPRFLWASASTATPVEVDASQSVVLRQAVSLQVNRATVGSVLAAIEAQTGITFGYSRAVVPLTKPVALRAENITVAAALRAILLDARVDVVLMPNRHLMLVKRESANARYQVGSVVGNVTDATTGGRLGDVDVSLESTRWRTTTDAKGRYRLGDVPAGSYAVIARRIGYAAERRSVTVSVGQEVTAEMALRPAATRLGEVVVTAQKREERLQDVPLSVAVVTPEEIERRGLVSAEDYLRGIPGVNQTTAPHGQSIVIRGLETTLTYQNFFSGATVATYFGETPTTSSLGMGNYTNVDLKLMDVERVEVLRGPQGTAFGNAALGGAVRTIPVAPKLDRIEGKIAAGYSVTSGTGGSNYSLQGVANLPLLKDKLALRAVGYRHEDTGIYRNVAGSDPNSFIQAAMTRYGAQGFAGDADHVGTSRVTGGRVAALFQASDDLRFTLSYLTQKGESDGYGQANSGIYEQSVLEIAPGHIRRGQKLGFFDSNLDLANAVAEYDFSWANLLVTYSYTRSRGEPVISLTRGSPLPISYYFPSYQRGHIGEVRLATQLAGAWNFLIGVYAEDFDDRATADARWQGSSEANFYAPGQSGSLGTSDTRRTQKQMAAFSEVSWEILSGVTLTGGLRAYDYDRTETSTTEGPFFGVTASDVAADALGTSFRGNLSYKPTEHALVYANWSQGFRLGRAQPGLISPGCDANDDGLLDGTNITIASTKIIQSDNVNSYEVGGKFTLLDRRLLIAADAYHIPWSDVPVRVTAESFGGPGLEEGCYPLYTTNAGSARSQGLEFQASFYVTDAFRVDLGASYVDAELTKDAPALNAPAGTRLPGSPEVNANLGLQYEFRLGSSHVFLRADPIYVGPFTNGLYAGAPAAMGGYVKLDASARAALGHTGVALFVRNLTNQDAFELGGANPTNPFDGFRLRPRTIGLQLSRNF